MVKEEEKYVGGHSPIGFYWTVFEKEVVLFLVFKMSANHFWQEYFLFFLFVCFLHKVVTKVG